MRIPRIESWPFAAYMVVGAVSSAFAGGCVLQWGGSHRQAFIAALVYYALVLSVTAAWFWLRQRQKDSEGRNDERS